MIKSVNSKDAISKMTVQVEFWFDMVWHQSGGEKSCRLKFIQQLSTDRGHDQWIEAQPPHLHWKDSTCTPCVNFSIARTGGSGRDIVYIDR